METKPSDSELDHLLGRGSIGAARRDAILESVLAQVQSERRLARRRRWPLAAGLGLVVVAATALVLVPRGTGFRAKGPTATAAQLTLECVGASLEACPAGSLLVVRASGLRGYVAAWAEPVPGGERIWYFSGDGKSPLLDGTAVPGVVTSHAARVGAEHAPGAYLVEIRVTERPMSRGELLRAPPALGSARARLTVVAP
jgi:hypothetical protein